MLFLYISNRLKRKSQIAIEYAYRFRGELSSRSVLRVFAGNKNRFESSYIKIARTLGLPGWNDESVDVLELVARWLHDKSNGEWLLILDNADDEALFSSQIPRIDRHQLTKSLKVNVPDVSHGSVLVTSRSHTAAFHLVNGGNQIIPVPTMSVSESMRLLRQKLPRDDSADEVVTESALVLDCLPLALTQAAAYISIGAMSIDISGYLDLFKKGKKKTGETA